MSHDNETRVLMRQGARDLSLDELEAVSGSGSNPPCFLTFSHLPGGGTDEDTECP